MKNVMKLFSILTFVMIGWLFSIEAKAADCPPADTSCPWVLKHITHVMTDGSGITVDLWFRVRVCNGVIEFAYDSVFAEDNGQFMEDFSIYHYNFSSFRELVDMHLIEWANTDLSNSPTVNPCPDSSKIVKFYGAACGVWVKCSYKVDPASERCDVGYTPPSPMYSVGLDKWVDVYKWQSCGTTCCRKTYTVCRGGSMTYGNSIIKITAVEKVKIIPCTDEGTFRDWKTGLVIPCQDGC